MYSLREDPIELSAFWYGLPSSVERVDAVYERPDHRIVFFVGQVYYVLGRTEYSLRIVYSDRENHLLVKLVSS